MASSIFLFPGSATTGNLVVGGSPAEIQLGGTTSAFPMLKQSGNTIQVRTADDSAFATIIAANVAAQTGFQIGVSNQLLISATAPTISSGFGTTPTIANQNGTGSFTVNVGTGGTATTGVIGLPAAPHGWTLACVDITSANTNTGLNTVQQSSTTTTATIQSQNSAGVATAWAASSIIQIIATAF